MTQNTKIGVIVLAVVILLGAGIAYTKYSQKSLPTGISSGGTSDTSSTTSNGNSEVSGIPEGASVTVTDRLNANLYSSTPKPSLDRPLPQGSLSAEAYAALKRKREQALVLIKENPAAMNNWMGLGIMHKQAGDNEGARIYWTYVATVNPENTTAHYNLAILYANYLKDPAQAVAEFGKAITADPKNAIPYTAYAEFLITQGKKDQALAILDQAVKAIPDSIDLLIAKAHLLRDMGNKASARLAYDAAIKLANTQDNANLAATLTAEKNAM